MNLTNGFLQISPSSTRPIGTRKSNEKGLSHYNYFNCNNQRGNPSSIDTYQAEKKQLTIKQMFHEKYLAQQKKKQKSLPHTFSHSKNNFLVQNGNNEHVMKTIDSVNEYAEQLRLTLIKQYKTHKMKSIRVKRAKASDEPMTSATQYEALDEIYEAKKLKQKNENEQMNKNPAYKTLNLLYQAIIDNSFKRRKKDEFELQAIRLPIVDRFNNRTETLKLQRQINFKCKGDHTKKESFSLSEPKIDSSYLKTTKTIFNTHKIHWKKQKSKNSRNIEDGQINPWTTIQQNALQ